LCPLIEEFSLVLKKNEMMAAQLLKGYIKKSAPKDALFKILKVTFFKIQKVGILNR